MVNKIEPLTESYYYILLCLYKGGNHGYGIMQDTLTLSKGRVKIGSGTMYGATSNMMKKGWIQERKSNQPEDERKRLYELTDLGKEVLNSEIIRLKQLIESSKRVFMGRDFNEKD
ncbi:PadR family transcriptional regulator [Cellulosilyticum sp. I15G10I2]|uniref:PadR family transcriptional regulator n=1 Tax=Cellulosilyticum sp. I15G10I2 TaxID=1892843 RepID=UPI00085BC2B8|nr:PadR family transcriptional regulator [Cellulosilyticum sp. I15G10I2]